MKKMRTQVFIFTLLLSLTFAITGQLAVADTNFLLKDTAGTQHQLDRKSTRLNSSHSRRSRMPSSA